MNPPAHSGTTAGTNLKGQNKTVNYFHLLYIILSLSLSLLSALPNSPFLSRSTFLITLFLFNTLPSVSPLSLSLLYCLTQSSCLSASQHCPSSSSLSLSLSHTHTPTVFLTNLSILVHLIMSHSHSFHLSLSLSLYLYLTHTFLLYEGSSYIFYLSLYSFFSF